MTKQKRSSNPLAYNWKEKMGVEFSGLANFRDFLVGIAIGGVFVIVAMVIAYVQFG